MVRSYDPDWKPPREEANEDLSAVYAAIGTAEAPKPPSDAETAAVTLEHNTDFQSLKASTMVQPQALVPRTWTDWLVDGLTPAFIFIMVYTVIFFLLDVRFIYTEVHDGNLRFVAACFLLGIVALNRLIARDGSSESMLYIGALAAAVGFYTFVTTGAFDVGSMARHFLNDNPYLATAFNMAVIAFIWWVVNRLTHECCVDENRSAGDIGILTGAARSIRESMRPKDPLDRLPPRPKREKRKPDHKLTYDDMVPQTVLEAYDPTEARPAPVKASARRLRDEARKGSSPQGRRHPGLSIFIVSVPVMAIFSLGLPVVQRGGERWVEAGEFYMGLYTFSALMLLLLTSLGGLREYFRSRRVPMPGLIGFFWIALGTLQVAVVLVAASQLPQPDLPPPAYIDEHQVDFWSRGSQFELSPISAAPIDILERSQFLERAGQVVLIALAIFLVYGSLRSLGYGVSALARQRHRLPRPLARFFDWLDGVLLRLMRVPRLPTRTRRRRIRPEVSQSASFQNSLGYKNADAMTANHHIEHAYAALCALAEDLGVPRETGQTPYEFLARFPRELHSMLSEAEDLTRLYVVAAYSPLEMNPKVLDRLRRFWMTYHRVRRRYVR